MGELVSPESVSSSKFAQLQYDAAACTCPVALRCEETQTPVHLGKTKGMASDSLPDFSFPLNGVWRIVSWGLGGRGGREGAQIIPYY